ncbi:hypothetical protein RFI_16304 [Reticulomyxa filosa]|uniref:Uncharacterized protein n=1 Tax=Reticulomyxa filosa TaxID=46433 RepID=X6N6J3_RETFI|nr:hypothetical protein RFI_16304 [Reticulomyxa filosa]|eukprot:ETO20907.1 hypothetical protein RFI_16304 [Reticulomyxa filosa]
MNERETKTLDERENVSKTALETLPNVFNELLDKGNKDQVLSHLDDVIDGLFRVLDNPKYRNNKQEAQNALNEILSSVMKSGNPDAVLYAVGLLTEEMNTERNSNPEARKQAMEQLKKLLFGDGTVSWAEVQPDKPIPYGSDTQNLPADGSPNREWLDIADGTQKGPSEDLYKPDDEHNADNSNDDGSGPTNGDGKSGGDKTDKKQGAEYDDDDDDDDDDGRKKKRKDQELEEETTYGGDTQNGKKIRDQQKNQLPSNRGKKGKENEMQIRFGKVKKEEPVDDEMSAEKADQKGGKNVQKQSHSGKDNKLSAQGTDEENVDNSDNGLNNKDDKNRNDNGDNNNNNNNNNNDNNNNNNDNNNNNNDNNNNNNDNNEKVYDNEQDNPNTVDGKGPGSDKNDKKGGNNGNDDKGKNGNAGNDVENKDGSKNNPGDDDTLIEYDDDAPNGSSNAKGNPENPNSNRGKGKNDADKDGVQEENDGLDNDGFQSSKAAHGQDDTYNPSDDADDNKEDDSKSPEEIGDEFRNVVKEGIEYALNDPNKDNSENASKVVHAINSKAPGYSKELDKEAQKKFFKWKSSQMKAPKKIEPSNKALPTLRVGEKRVHTIDQTVEINIKPPVMPDI